MVRYGLLNFLFDIIMISRHYIAVKHIDAVRAFAPKALVVFDTVDLHFLREQREARKRQPDADRRKSGNQYLLHRTTPVERLRRSWLGRPPAVPSQIHRPGP